MRAQWIEAKVAAAVTAPLQGTIQAPSCDRDRGAAVIIGDSRISQWPMRLFQDGLVVNKGIAGETTLQLTARFQRDVLACPPRVMLIAAGINDLVAASLAPDATAREIIARVPDILIAMAEAAARSGVAVSVATVIPPARPDLLRRTVWSEAIRSYVRDVNARLRAHPWTGAVTLVDFAAALDARGTGILPDKFRRDTLHLNAAAYECLTLLLPFSSASTVFPRAVRLSCEVGEDAG